MAEAGRATAIPGRRAPAQTSLHARRRHGTSPGAVAQRVSGASGFAAPPITPLPVAYVCCTGAGIQEPSPIVDCRETVRRARMAEGERAQSTRGFANGPLSGSLGRGPCRRHMRPPQASLQAALVVEATCDPAPAPGARQHACGRGLGPGALRHTARPAAPSYKSATSLRLASVSPSM